MFVVFLQTANSVTVLDQSLLENLTHSEAECNGRIGRCARFLSIDSFDEREKRRVRHRHYDEKQSV